MNVLLVSTYELGHQPFGLASPAAWLAEHGHQIACADLCVESLAADQVRKADLVAFYLPMHTATRLAAKVIEKVRGLNPAAHICCYGLYAPLNEAYLRSLGASTILGGEFEPGLVSLLERLAGTGSRLQTEPLISLDRLQFRVPLRSGLPPLETYGRLETAAGSRAPRNGCWFQTHRLYRSQPGLQASVPALPRGPGVSREFPGGAARGGAGRHSAAGGRRRRAHQLRRSRFLQRTHARHAHRGRAASRMARRHLRCHHQDRTLAEAA